MRLYLYTVRTTDGRRAQVEAHDGAEAIRLSGFDPSTIAPWYPFCTAALPTIEEQEARRMTDETKAKLRERKKLLKEIGARKMHKMIDYDREKSSQEWWHDIETGKRTTVNKNNGELNADFIRRQLKIDTPAPTVPDKRIQPKKAQNEAPLPLEMPEIEARQQKLF